MYVYARIIKNFGGPVRILCTLLRAGGAKETDRPGDGVGKKRGKNIYIKYIRGRRDAGTEKRERERVLRFYIRAGRSVTGPIIYPRAVFPFLISTVTSAAAARVSLRRPWPASPSAGRPLPPAAFLFLLKCFLFVLE